MSDSAKRTNPYPGPNPFERDDRLYGRDQELRDLLDLLIAERIVLFYSPSGAGKTSLIQAALIPELELKNFRVLPLIRVGLDRPLGVSGGNRYLLSVLQSLEKNSSNEQPIKPSEWTEISLEGYLNAHVSGGDAGDYIVLIFDQFEEMLTADPTDIPAKEAFLREVGQTLRNRHRWALFAMREEYIAGLDPYLNLLPTQLDTTYRLDLLDVDAAIKAICYPARDQEVDFTADAAQTLVNNLSMVQVQTSDGLIVRVPGPYVEPVQLQVVCRRLWERLAPDDVQIDQTDVGTMGDVDSALRLYYAESVEAIAKATGVSERVIRDWVEQQLITESGFRGQALQDESANQGLDNRAISRLVDAHLVRADRRRGATWFELAHDRLVWPVRADNESWRLAHLSTLQQRATLWDRGKRPAGLLLQGQDLVEAEGWASAHSDKLEPHERDFLTACQTARRESRRVRRLQRAIIAAIVGVIVIIALTGFVLYSRAKTEATLALSRQLAAQSLSHVDDEYDLALLLALEADRIADSEAKRRLTWYDWLGTLGQKADRASDTAVETRGTLLTSLEHNPNLLAFLKREHVAEVSAVAFNPRNGALASSSLDGSIRLWQPTAATSGSTLLSSGDASVTTLAYSPDGEMLVAGYDSGVLALWNLDASLPTSHTVTAHTNLVLDLVFSPDGQLLASIGKGDIALWRITPSGFELASRQGAAAGVGEVFALAFRPDGKAVVSGHKGGQIRFWSAAEGRLDPVANIETGLEQVDALAFSPDGLLLAAAGSFALDEKKPQPRILLYALVESDPSAASGLVTNEPNVLTGHHDVIDSLAFSPDGTVLASGSRDESIMIWRKTIDGWDGTQMLGHLGPVRSLAFSPVCVQPEGSASQDPDAGCELLLASGGADANVILWNPNLDVRTRLGVRPLMSYPEEIWSIALSRNCSAELDRPTSQSENQVESEPEAWCGGWLATGSKEGSVKLWNLATSEEMTIASQTGIPVRSLDYSPDSRQLAAAQDDGSVLVWQPGNTSTGYAEFAHLEHSRQAPVTAVEFHPDGRFLAAGSSDWDIRLWSLVATPPSAAQTLHDPTVGWLYGVAFSPDGRHFAAAGGLADKNSGELTGALIIWNLTKDSTVGATQTYTHSSTLTHVAFNSDSTYVAASSADGEVLLLDLSAEKPQILGQHGRGSTAIAFSQVGGAGLLASGDIDNTVALWDAASGRMIGRPLKGHNNSISAVVFDADGRRLVSADTDGAIDVWNVYPASWQEQACRIANRRLTDAEWQQYIGKGYPTDQVCPSP